jgi:hypothetical protein
MGKKVFTGSSYGKNIRIDATNSNNPTLIHRAVTGVTDYDELWLYAINNSASDVVLTLLWGGTEDRDKIQETIDPSSGLFMVVPGFLIHNNLEVVAYADTTAVLNVSGYVNRLEN